MTNPSSQTLKHKFRAKTILDVAICVIFCSILCFIFSVLRLYQLFLLLSREKKFHQITSLSDSFLSKYFPVWFNFGHFHEKVTIPPHWYHHYCLCLKSKWIMLRATPGWSSTITTSRCRNCAWQRKGQHNLYFIYNLCTCFNQEPELWSVQTN